jgi:hypothetical protein
MDKSDLKDYFVKVLLKLTKDLKGAERTKALRQIEQKFIGAIVEVDSV